VKGVGEVVGRAEMLIINEMMGDWPDDVEVHAGTSWLDRITHFKGRIYIAQGRG
jgi:hypothetical protein